MPSRSTCRRQYKQQARLERLTADQKRAEAARLLAAWKKEARTRAARLTFWI